MKDETTYTNEYVVVNDSKNLMMICNVVGFKPKVQGWLIRPNPDPQLLGELPPSITSKFTKEQSKLWLDSLLCRIWEMYILWEKGLHSLLLSRVLLRVHQVVLPLLPAKPDELLATDCHIPRWHLHGLQHGLLQYQEQVMGHPEGEVQIRVLPPTVLRLVQR